MKSIMLSIQPRHVENICTVVGHENGKPIYKKTVEVRKTAPKCETPFKCYIYETKGLCDTPTFVDEDGHISYRGRGAVIGEFVCDRIVPFKIDCEMSVHVESFQQSALSWKEFIEYAGDKSYIYGLHIFDLKIYDTPKELGEFCTACNKTGNDDCGDCPYLRVTRCSYPCDDDIDTWCEVDNRKPIERPFQSWGYVCSNE